MAEKTIALIRKMPSCNISGSQLSIENLPNNNKTPNHGEKPINCLFSSNE
jgi:hypothetical protein